MEVKYISEFNAFHDWLVSNSSIPTSARFLWVTLMHYWNICGRKEEFSVPLSALELDSGLSKSGVIRAREALKHFGLIVFVQGKSKSNGSAKYRLNHFGNRAMTPNPTPNPTPFIEIEKEVENIKAAAARAKDKPFSDVFKAYQDNVHPITGPIEQDGLRDLLDTYGEKWVLAGIEEAAKNNGRSLKYISAILKRWEREGFKTDRKKPGGGIPMVRSAPNKADEENLATILSIIGE